MSFRLRDFPRVNRSAIGIRELRMVRASPDTKPTGNYSPLAFAVMWRHFRSPLYRSHFRVPHSKGNGNCQTLTLAAEDRTADPRVQVSGNEMQILCGTRLGSVGSGSLEATPLTVEWACSRRCAHEGCSSFQQSMPCNICTKIPGGRVRKLSWPSARAFSTAAKRENKENNENNENRTAWVRLKRVIWNPRSCLSPLKYLGCHLVEIMQSWDGLV